MHPELLATGPLWALLESDIMSGETLCYVAMGKLSVVRADTCSRSRRGAILWVDARRTGRLVGRVHRGEVPVDDGLDS